MKERATIRKSYDQFSTYEGNQHIASEYAITKLVKLIDEFKTTRVLEIGLGIGSIAGTLLEVFKTRNLDYYGTEKNIFCLQSLKSNLDQKYQKLKIFSDVTALEEELKFNLIIIDGSDKHLHLIKKHVASAGIIAIEGDRSLQIDLVKQVFPNYLYVHSISKNRNHSSSPFSSDHWQGGIKIIFIQPTLKQRVWWMREKLETKLKYLYRSLN